MAKKKNTQQPVVDGNDLLDNMTPEQIAQARNEFRNNMREKFGEFIEVLDEDATDEDIAAARKDFEDEVKKYQNKTYLISGAEDGLALKYAEFLKEFNTNYNEWTKGSWRGIIRFDKVISKHIEELKADTDKPFEVDYQTLIFLYNAMGNPKGMGLASAKAMAVMENYNEETDKPFEEDVPVTYSGVLERVIDHVHRIQDIDKMLIIYRERIAITAGGVKFNFKISKVEDFKRLHTVWVTANVPDDPAELNKIANM